METNIVDQEGAQLVIALMISYITEAGKDIAPIPREELLGKLLIFGVGMCLAEPEWAGNLVEHTISPGHTSEEFLTVTRRILRRIEGTSLAYTEFKAKVESNAKEEVDDAKPTS